MFKFRLFDLLDATWHLEIAQKDAAEKNDPTPSKVGEIDHGFYQEVINKMRAECERFGLDSTLDQIGRIDITLSAGSIYGAYTTFTNQTQQVWECLKTDLDKRVFMHMAPADAKYHQHERLFGEEVHTSFSEARPDIQAVGNCISVGLYTASVYHSMRVAEFGLRKLARKLRVKLTDKGKPLHVEYATWDKVITACKNEIDTIRQKSAGPQKEAKLSLYSDAADHCLFMKDIWRNNVSHTRKPYSKYAAMAVLGRVEDFMRFLAANMA
jgi:hypothetical protein